MQISIQFHSFPQMGNSLTLQHKWDDGQGPYKSLIGQRQYQLSGREHDWAIALSPTALIVYSLLQSNAQDTLGAIAQCLCQYFST